MPDRLQQQVHLHSLDGESLAEVLELPDPLGVDRNEALRQLAYVERYVKQELKGHAFIVEDHYIDRDYMEDHSVFYSKSLFPYENHCRRLHFFTLTPEQLEQELAKLREQTLPEASFRDACVRFSADHYLGFSVIKPLPGCPVGRTVLKCLPEKTDKGFTRHFDCSCHYPVHLLGIPLSVHGLAFQQQDLGVSACATTALWSSLQRARELEATGAATPAQITMRASQYHLPFGRPLPSDGLSLDQMCQAIRSLGYSPNLYRAESFEVSRNLIYSAVRSRISPVLVLSSEDERFGHAVSVAGMKLVDPHPPATEGQLTDDKASDLIALYVHDDRFGPYLRVEVSEEKTPKNDLRFVLRLEQEREKWILTHILIPLHPKIHLSFGELQLAGLELVEQISVCRDEVLAAAPMATTLQHWLVRSHGYADILRFGRLHLNPDQIQDLCATVPFSRYLGVVRTEAPDLDPVDLVVDTTSTLRNLNPLAIVMSGQTRSNSYDIVSYLQTRYRCPVIA